MTDVQLELRELYDELNELDKLQTLVQEFIVMADSHPETEYLWYYELGTIIQRKYQDTQNENDLQKSQEAFERANELFISFSPETQKHLNRLLFPGMHDDIPEQLDPIQEAFAAYYAAADEVRANPSPDSALAHMQEWRDRFEKIIAENPQSEFVAGAKRMLLGLYNGFEEYDKSQALLREMISETSMLEERIYFLNQLGTVSRRRYRTTQYENDIQESRGAFEQANELFLSLPPERRDGRLGGMQIINLGTAAGTASDAGDHERAATLTRSARKLFQSSSESTQQYVASTYGLESITNQEMHRWIYVKKEANALECLAILSNLPSYRWAPSYYALKYATSWYKDDSDGFQNFVANWLTENPFDDRTPILMTYLGSSYFDDGLYDKALPIYENLRDNHRADFQRLEPATFEKGRGGYYEWILFNLAKIYRQQGDAGRTESVRTELTALLPESPLVKFLYGNESSEETWTLPERTRLTPLRITLLVVGIVMILLGLYLACMREKKQVV